MKMAGLKRRHLTQIIFLIGVVLLMPASILYGVQGQPDISENVEIYATVSKYAVVSVQTQPMNFGVFTGQPNQEKGPYDNAVFKVETNTPLTIKFSGGDLARNNSIIKTAYKANINGGDTLGYFNRNYPNYDVVSDLITSQTGLTTVLYEVIGWVKTGPYVSSQEAGLYTANIILTVSAQ